MKYRIRFGDGRGPVVPEREFDSPPLVPGVGDYVFTDGMEAANRVTEKTYQYMKDDVTGEDVSVVVLIVEQVPAV